MSQIEFIVNKKTEPTAEDVSLYPKRAFLRLKNIIKEIEKINSDKTEKINLEDKDKKNLFQFSKDWCKKLEQIFLISPASTTIYVDYFATTEGKNRLLETANINVESQDPNEVEKTIYKNAHILSGLDTKTLDELLSRAAGYSDEKLGNALANGADSSGNMEIKGIEVPNRIAVLQNPEESLKKIEKLREIKSELKREAGEMKNSGQKDNLALVKMAILKMFLDRTNLMIMDEYPGAMAVSNKARTVGKNELNKEELRLMEYFRGLESPNKNLSRLDKLTYGASNYFEEGWRVQVPKELLEEARKIAEENEALLLKKEERIKNLGLDKKLLMAENVDSSQRVKWIEEILEKNGIKSDYPPDTYSPRRPGPAPDNKWQCVPTKNTDISEVKFKRKALLDPAQKKSSILYAITKSCGHEMTHIFQAENSQKIPLEFPQKIIDNRRASIITEGGATSAENKLRRAAFGYENLPSPSYVYAMVEKTSGGNFLDCVKVFYDCEMRKAKKDYLQHNISEESFQKEIRASIKIAVSATKRLFKEEADLKTRDSFLTRSRDTVYLEQATLVRKLSGTNLEKVLFIAGIAPHEIPILMRFGLLDLNDIKEPDYQAALKIWEREKPKYLLEEAA